MVLDDSLKVMFCTLHICGIVDSACPDNDRRQTYFGNRKVCCKVFSSLGQIFFEKNLEIWSGSMLSLLLWLDIVWHAILDVHHWEGCDWPPNEFAVRQWSQIYSRCHQRNIQIIKKKKKSWNFYNLKIIEDIRMSEITRRDS